MAKESVHVSLSHHHGTHQSDLILASASLPALRPALMGNEV